MKTNIKLIVLTVFLIIFVLTALLPCLYKMESYSNPTCIHKDNLYSAYDYARRAEVMNYNYSQNTNNANSGNNSNSSESITTRDNILTTFFLIQKCFSNSLEQIHSIGHFEVLRFNQEVNGLRDSIERDLNNSLDSQTNTKNLISNGVNNIVSLYINHGGDKDYVPNCLDRNLQNNNCQNLNLEQSSNFYDIQDAPNKKVKII